MAIQWGPLALAIAIPVGLGFGVSLLSSSGLKNWFPYIRKPSWEPPPWFFGPTWSLLYTCMGVASYLVWKAGTPLSATAFKLYGTQLIFNLAWQPLFFAVNNMTLAQIDNLAALGFAAATALAFREIHRTAGLLMVPYVGFLVFANALNFQVARLNPGGKPPKDSALTADLAQPQDMKNPGQSGYRPAPQASQHFLQGRTSIKSRAPLRITAAMPLGPQHRRYTNHARPQQQHRISRTVGIPPAAGCRLMHAPAGASAASLL